MDTTKLIIYTVLCVAAYFVGSINFAIIFSKKAGKDILKSGSGNPGTMNVLRVAGKKWGALTFLCDAVKGLTFALIARLFFCENSFALALIIGFIAIIGHVFPVYTRFKGGKGVATSIGVFMAIQPIPTCIVLIFLILWLFFGKYGFIGSLVAITILSVVSCIINRNCITCIVISLAIALLVWWTHRSNIVRLIKGKENTLQLAMKDQPSPQDSNDTDKAPK
ncbi:MAG: glycerol-3-phosphate 1-O-acyltransferase PlsY [Christensenellales bacterium]